MFLDKKAFERSCKHVYLQLNIKIHKSMRTNLKHIPGFLSLVLASAFIISCSKPAPTPTPTPVQKTPATSLQISVNDVSSGASTPAINAKAQLFKTDLDRQNKTNPLTTLVTGDANGNVMFDSLSAIDYYYNAYSNDLTKSNGPAGNHTTPLTSGVLNKRSASIK